METVKKKPVVWIILGILGVLGLFGFTLRSFFHPYRIPSGSMAPTLPAGEYVLVDDWAFQKIGDIEYGDVTVFAAPEAAVMRKGGAPSTYIFRVVGKSGDLISFNSNGEISRNAKALESVTKGDETFERQSGEWYQVYLGKCRVSADHKVPDGHLFVVGDNRPSAFDSRYWGTLPFESVKGKARVD